MLKKPTLIFTRIIVAFLLVSAVVPAFAQQVKEPLKTIIIDAGHGGNDPGAEGEYSNEATLTLAIAKRVVRKMQQVMPEVKIVETRTDENLPGNLRDKNEANRLRAKIANEAKGDLFISIHVNSLPPKYRRVANGTRQETYYVYQGKGKKRKRVKKTRTVTNWVNVRIPHTRVGTETYIWATGKNDAKKQFVKNESEEIVAEQADSNYVYFESPEAKILASLRTAKYFSNSKLLGELVEEELVKSSGRPSAGVLQRDWAGIWVLQATAMPSILVETGFICTPEDEAYLNSEKGQEEIADSIVNAVLRYRAALSNGKDTVITKADRR